MAAVCEAVLVVVYNARSIFKKDVLFRYIFNIVRPLIALGIISYLKADYPRSRKGKVKVKAN